MRYVFCGRSLAVWYGIPEMSSMVWSGGDYELNSEGVLWTPTTHYGKLTHVLFV